MLGATGQQSPAGTLYVIGMPIGNAGDLSPRALQTLRDADLIACEDTRRIARLLAEHHIATPTVSYYEHNEHIRAAAIVERMMRGETVALVSDAGTPAISDPGYRLVRLALDNGITVKAVPGPSAVIAALSVAGLPTDRFTFEGFLPARDAARRKVLESLAGERRTIIVFEAARRLKDTLAEMAVAFGDERQAAVVREISKTHEETIRGSIAELAEIFAQRAALGEVTLVIQGATDARVHSRELDEEAAIAAMCEAGLSLKKASEVVAKLTGTGRREIYQRALCNRRSIE